MNATIYARGQMVIPAEARRLARLGKGEVVSGHPDGDGRLVLIRLEKPIPVPAKIRIIRRRGKHAVGVTEGVVSTGEIQKFIDEFP